MTADKHLPEPPVTSDLDLRGFRWMKLDLTALLNSDFNTILDDTAWRAGVTLWAKAWHQVPAGSLPNDDSTLCNFAGLGRDLKTWKRIRRDALHGFIECSDGRLYHHFLCARAVDAQAERDRFENRKEADRLRKAALKQGIIPPENDDNSSGKSAGKSPPSTGNPVEFAVEGAERSGATKQPTSNSGKQSSVAARESGPPAATILLRELSEALDEHGISVPANSSSNLRFAQQWHEMGITPDLGRPVFDRLALNLSRSADPRLTTLKYFAAAIAEVAAENAPATPEERTKARGHMLMFAGLWRNERDRYPRGMGEPGTPDCKLDPDIQAWLLGTGPAPDDMTERDPTTVATAQHASIGNRGAA